MTPSYIDRLSPVQQKLPYAKYLDYPYPNPSIPAAVAAKIAVPMTPAKALRLDRVNDLLYPEYDADDTGYCVLEDGSGYIGETIHFPGSSREMFEWWFAWHGLEEVRYKIWDPEAHVTSSVSAGHIGKRLDASLPWKERIIGTAHFTTHIARDGAYDPAVMCFVPPEIFGFDMAFAKGENLSIVAALHGKADSPLPSLSSIRVLRDAEDGFVMRIYFWQGMIPVGGHCVRVGGEIAIEESAYLANHCAREYNRLAFILPHIYTENHSVHCRPEEFRTINF
ncbi:MAG: hypothetical protein LBH09_01815 [Peptococcaceae bacterium]|nr:hypothetical protein [Peptococcaceae bacterium]